MAKIPKLTSFITSRAKSNTTVQNAGGKMSDALNIEGIAKYIKDNIRNILTKSAGEEVELPKVSHDYIEKMSIKTREEDKIKTLLLSIKGKEENPGISVQLSKGTRDEILADIDKYDFVERFTNNIDELKSYFIYGR